MSFGDGCARGKRRRVRHGDPVRRAGAGRALAAAEPGEVAWFAAPGPAGRLVLAVDSAGNVCVGTWLGGAITMVAPDGSSEFVLPAGRQGGPAGPGRRRQGRPSMFRSQGHEALCVHSGVA